MSAIDTVLADGKPAHKRLFFDCNPVDATDTVYRIPVRGDLWKDFEFYLKTSDATRLVYWMNDVLRNMPQDPLTVKVVSADGKKVVKTVTATCTKLPSGVYELAVTLPRRVEKFCVVLGEGNRLLNTLDQDLSSRPW